MKININWKAICVSGFFAACFLLVLYAFLINELTSGTYLIKNYQSQIKKMTQENRNLEVSFAETGFIENLEERAREMSFEKTASVKYIQILDTSLAKAK